MRERGSVFVAKSSQENVSALRCHAPCMNQPVRIEQWLGTLEPEGVETIDCKELAVRRGWR